MYFCLVVDAPCVILCTMNPINKISIPANIQTSMMVIDTHEAWYCKGGGDKVGLPVGEFVVGVGTVGDCVGEAVVGAFVGIKVGGGVGEAVVGVFVGVKVGAGVGEAVVGAFVGVKVGAVVGAFVGVKVGAIVGGDNTGESVGALALIHEQPVEGVKS